jgi:hypothetical protein
MAGLSLFQINKKLDDINAQLQGQLDGKVAFASFIVDGKSLNASLTANGLILDSGTNMLLGVDNVNKRIVFNCTYTHPDTHPASMILTDSTHRFVSDAQVEAWNNATGVSILNKGNEIITAINNATGSATIGGQYVTVNGASKIESGSILGTHIASGTLALTNLQTAVQTIVNNGQTAYNGLADMSNDNKLTPSEKLTIKKDWDAIVAEKPSYESDATLYGITTEKTDYLNAYNALSDYLINASTGVLNNMAVTSDISGSTFRSKFSNYYSKRVLLAQKVSASIKAIADTASNGVGSALSQISDMGNDNKLTPSEKLTVKKDWSIIAAEKPILEAQATAHNITTEKTDYITSYSTLDNFLNNTSTGVLKSMTTTSDVTGGALRTYLADYQTKRITLTKKISDLIKGVADTATITATTAQTTATNVNQQIVDMSSDSKLTPVEKIRLKKDWEIIVAEKSLYESQAITYGLISPKDDYVTAYNNLNTYLNDTKVGLLLSMSTTSTIDGVTFRSKFNDYYTKKSILMQKLSDTIKNTADNALVSVADMSNDNKLTASEKLLLKKDWENILAEKPTLESQATTYNISTEKTDYLNSYNDLDNYLNHPTNGVLRSMSTTTDIVGSTMRTFFSSYNTKRTILMKKISDTIKGVADGAANNATSAYNAVNDMGNDNKLTPAEKLKLKKEWGEIVDEYSQLLDQATSFNISTEKAAYTLAYNNLNAYLNNSTNGILLSMTTTTDISGDTLRTKFKDYYSKKSTLTVKLSNVVKGVADSAVSTANTVTAQINDISNDNKLTAKDKSIALKDWNIILNEKPTLENQATEYEITTEKTDYVNAYNALNTYLNDAKTGVLISMTTTSTIDGATFRNKFSDYFAKKAILLKVMTNKVKTIADSASTAIVDMSSDSKLTASEKNQTLKEWNIIVAEKSTIETQATNYGVTTEKTDYIAAYNTLNDYLNNTTTGLLKSMSSTSTIDGPTFRSKFSTYYDKKAILMKKISDVVKTAADSASTTATAASTTASAALGQLSDMSDDNKLTPSEKAQLKKEWDIIVGEKPTYEAQATSYNITTEKTNYVNAYNALNTYLNNTVDGPLRFLTTTSSIVGSTMRAKFTDYYTSKANLLKKLSDVVKATADKADTAVTTWGHTTDTTKIDGAQIFTGSITADSIKAGEIHAEKIDWPTMPKTSPVRNTVLGCLLNSVGRPAYMYGDDFTLNITGQSTPLVLSFSDWYTDVGSRDYVYYMTTNTTLSLPANKQCYIYAQRNATNGDITFGYTFNKPVFTPLEPTVNDMVPNMTSLIAPSGEVIHTGTVSNTNSYWKAYYVSPHAVFSTYTDARKAGWRAYCDQESSIGYKFSQTIYGAIINRYVVKMNKLYGAKSWKFQASNDNKTWVDLDIVTNMNFATNSSAKTETFTFKSGTTTTTITQYTVTRDVNNTSQYLYYRLLFNKDGNLSTSYLEIQDFAMYAIPEFWYDTRKYQMFKYTAPGWERRQMIFLGEARTTAVTGMDTDGISTLIQYEPCNKYDSGWIDVTNTTIPYVLSTNIGTNQELQKIIMYFRKSGDYDSCVINGYGDGYGVKAFGATDNNTLKFITGGTYINPPGAVAVGASDVNTASGQYRVIVERGF